MKITKQSILNGSTIHPGLVLIAMGMALVLALGRGVLAANPSGPLRIQVVAAPNFVVDSNAGTPASQSPRSAFIGARFFNDGPSDITNLTVYIGQYAGGTNPVPGTFPRRAHPGLTGPLPGGQFALTLESGSAGSSDATRKVGTLGAGQSVTVYWLVGYPILDVNRIPVWGSGPDSSDDLWLNYDIWGSAQSGGTTLAAAQTTKATMRNEISAMANKIYPNTANQVPQQYQDMLQQYAPTWTNIAADGTVGTRIVAEGIWYMLGNVGMGYDCDGDLVFDHDAWLQPVGNPALYDAGAFRLAKTRAMLIVQLKGGGEQVVMAEDQLYFKDLPENNSVVGFVRYEFVPLLAGVRSQLTPYQEAASGSNNEKFNGDYGATIGNGMNGGASVVEVAKGVSASNAVPGATLQYSIAYTNAGTQKVGDSDIFLPLVVQDHIPTGTTYVAGSAAISNALPAGVTGYTIVFSTNNGLSWLASEPAAATNVTDIQWWLSHTLQPGAAGAIRFSVQVASPYVYPPLVVNTGGLGIGNTPPFATSTATTLVSGVNRLGDTVFADTGAGGGLLGNGIQEGTEPGLSNILVTLYYDNNANRLADAGDWRIGVTRTAANGIYAFTNLADGRYVAVVDTADANLPVGYTLTSSNGWPVALDPGRAATGGVSVLTADFGFAPALTLTKTLAAAGPLYEGRSVAYSIEVTNNLPGDGQGNGAPVTYTVWASNLNAAETTTGWQVPSNAVGQPNGTSSTDSFISNPNDYLALTDFRLPAPTGAITNVQVLVAVDVVAPWRAGDTFGVTLITSAGVEFFRRSYVGTAALATGTLVLDVTTNRAWQWSDFNSSNVCIRLDAQKGGGVNQGGWIGVDAAAFRIRSSITYAAGSSANTLDPVPLKDVYDTGLLQFVSASPSPASVTTHGAVGTIAWDNLGPLPPGAGRTVSLAFKALQPAGNLAAVVTNAASSTNAFFANGRPANPALSQVATNLLPTGVIGDFIWRDENRNGLQDTNEFGIPNVQVVLAPPTNVNLGAGAGVWLTNATDRAGYFLFEGIAETGRYVVIVRTSSLPAGATNTWSEMNGAISPTNVTVVTNLFPASTGGLDTHRTADFGYSWTAATINGYLWNDLNRSGTPARDPGEPGFTNVTVYLYAATNLSAAIGTNRTDSTGYFSFTGTYSGSYVVAAATATGGMTNSAWIQTFDTDGLASTGRVTVAALPGKTASADFSYVQTGPYAIGDTLFYDWNGNGTQDAADEGLRAIPVFLYRDINGNGAVDSGVDVLLAATNTDSAGLYLFTNAPPGAFLVEVQQGASNFPALYTITADPDGVKDGVGALTLTNASNRDQDFGYRAYGSGSIGDTVWRDLDADGLQSGPLETGISNVAVRLYGDLNGDGAFVLLAATNTDASGLYLFSNLPDAAYRVEVQTGGAGLPVDAFGFPVVPTTATNVAVTVAGGAVLNADFGFAALGAVGDTIFWDNNASGSQDAYERGVTGVTVSLWRDLNTNGVRDAGDALFDSRVTDTNGHYLFTALPQGPYVVQVATNGALTNAMLTAAPALDGAPLTNPALQAVYGQYAVRVQPGTAFMGADFGFKPVGALGKMVWIDSNANGVREDGEPGVPGATLVLSNATAVLTNRTDSDGYYSFGNVADGTYALRVLTNGFPAGLAPTVDPDGTNTPGLVASLVISNGHVVAVGGTPRADFDMMLDFGYRYAGSNSLSGTVGLDGAPQDGRLGTGPSGVSADELAFGGESVYLYVWRDANSNGTPEAGEATYIGSTQTATNGDYAFAGLPSSLGAGTNRYLVSMAAPADHLRLTTTNGSTPALWVTPTTNASGEVLSAYQVVAIGSTITNIDFAYKSTWNYDFGDLPASYSTLLSDAPQGPQHRVLAVPTLYLGAGVSSEINGQPSATASLDTYEDGVTTSGIWQNATNGAQVRIVVGAGGGWLAGYIDFNRNGFFADSGEMPIGQAVTAGTYTVTLNVPAGTILASSNTAIYARFRLFPSRPAFPELAYSGAADNGEVEDYLWNFGSVGDVVWVDANRNGIREGGEAALASARVFVDLNSNGVWNAGEPSAVTDGSGRYGIGGFPAGAYRIAVDTSTLPVGLVAGYDADGGTDSRAQATLSDGQIVTNADFGYAYPSAAVQLVKTAGGAGDGLTLYTLAGSNIVYRYHVVNAGETYLVNLAVSDDKLGSVGTVAGPLAPGASFDLYRTNLNVMAPVTNIGTVVATPAVADGTPIAALADVTDTDDAVVLLGAEIRGIVWKENGGAIDGLRTNDLPYARVSVTLLTGGTNGAWTAGATTDVDGAYAFTNVSTGVAYTVVFAVPKTNTLYRYFAPSAAYVMADGTNRNPVGNDAVFQSLDSNVAYAVASIGSTQIAVGAIVYRDAGLGTNDPAHTLSTAIGLRLVETADGLFVELCTVDEVAEGLPITLYVLCPNGTPKKIGEVTSRGGSQRYLIPVSRGWLNGREVFSLVVVDESGASHTLPGITLEAFKARATRMDKQGMTITWNSLPGRVYDIYTCNRMGDPWKKVVANVEAVGDTCSAVVPTAGAPQAFFKIVMQDERN